MLFGAACRSGIPAREREDVFTTTPSCGKCLVPDGLQRISDAPQITQVITRSDMTNCLADVADSFTKHGGSRGYPLLMSDTTALINGPRSPGTTPSMAKTYQRDRPAGWQRLYEANGIPRGSLRRLRHIATEFSQLIVWDVS